MITITIKTDNAAFEDDRDREVARILRELADRFESGRIQPGEATRDFNGNRVGQVKITGGSK